MCLGWASEAVAETGCTGVSQLAWRMPDWATTLLLQQAAACSRPPSLPPKSCLNLAPAPACSPPSSHFQPERKENPFLGLPAACKTPYQGAQSQKTPLGPGVCMAAFLELPVLLCLAVCSLPQTHSPAALLPA